MAGRTILSSAIVLLGIAVVGAQTSGSESTKLGGDKAEWTSTTTESATNDQQKQWLNRGKPITITGELVDVSCYLQLGKTGEKHIDCGGKCIRQGQPAGILTAKKELYLVIPEEHHPRRDGQVDIKEKLAVNISKQVTVTGMVQATKQGKAIFVSAEGLK